MDPLERLWANARSKRKQHANESEIHLKERRQSDAQAHREVSLEQWRERKERDRQQQRCRRSTETAEHRDRRLDAQRVRLRNKRCRVQGAGEWACFVPRPVDIDARRPVVLVGDPTPCYILSVLRP